MRDNTLRGSRLGARSLASDEGIELSERKRVTYTCASCGKESVMTFSMDAEEPSAWPCTHCGRDAHLDAATEAPVLIADEEKVARTPFDMLLERRTREELEIILEERLQYLRSRRGEEQIGA